MSRQKLIKLLADGYGLFTWNSYGESIDLKRQYGWRPPTAQDLPSRVYDGLQLVPAQPIAELMRWMDLLIDEWTTQAEAVMSKFGYETGRLAWSS